jgi:hypothetical protein
MEKYNRFLYGFVPGLLIPVLFLWAYLNRFYPGDTPFLETMKQLYPGIILGKLLLLSVMPNLILVFVFYKFEGFKIASGLILGGMPYFIASIFML